MLDPDVVLRADSGTGVVPLVGAAAVAGQALTFRRLGGRPAHGARQRHGRRGHGPAGRPMAIMAFTIVDGRIVEIDILADPARVAALDLSVLDDSD